VKSKKNDLYVYNTKMYRSDLTVVKDFASRVAIDDGSCATSSIIALMLVPASVNTTKLKNTKKKKYLYKSSLVFKKKKKSLFFLPLSPLTC
jgi:hypothetical protein